MKKLIGWLIILFCSFFLLIYCIAFLLLVVNILNNNPIFTTNISTFKLIIAASTTIAFVYLLILGLKKGIKKVKKEPQIELHPYNYQIELHLKSGIEYKQYRNYVIESYFGKPTKWLIVLIFIVCILVINFDSSIDTSENIYFITFFMVGISLAFYPLTQIRKSYNSNKILHQEIAYTITNESIHLKSETIDANQKWNNFVMLKETKDFILLYQNKLTATFLPKKMFSEVELNEFKQFLQSLPLKK